jgi:hypothetical protein
MYGTLSLTDLLSDYSNQTVYEYSPDRMWDQVDAYLAARNQLVNETLNLLAVRDTERIWRDGGLADDFVFQRLDEFAAPAPQKAAGVSFAAGAPLEMWGVGVQWTSSYFERKSVREFTLQFDKIAQGDIERLFNELQRALFTPTNNTTYTDYWVDRLPITIRRLYNADSTYIPNGADGTTFNAATHTHYLARVAALAASDISATVDTVAEHFSAGQLRLHINRAQEAAVRAFTSNFKAYQSPMIEIRGTTDIARGNLQLLSPNDREIGLWDDKAIVSVKPWIPANYMFAYMEGAPAPLVMRVPASGLGGGNLFFEDEHRHMPLTAQFMGRYFGFGARNRANGAVLYTGGTTYVSPTIA